MSNIRLMTFGELRSCFSPDDDVASIMVCLEILFEDDEETVILVSHNQRVDVDYEPLARRIYNSFARLAE